MQNLCSSCTRDEDEARKIRSGQSSIQLLALITDLPLSLPVQRVAKRGKILVRIEVRSSDRRRKGTKGKVGCGHGTVLVLSRLPLILQSVPVEGVPQKYPLSLFATHCNA